MIFDKCPLHSLICINTWITLEVPLLQECFFNVSFSLQLGGCIYVNISSFLQPLLTMDYVWCSAFRFWTYNCFDEGLKSIAVILILTILVRCEAHKHTHTHLNNQSDSHMHALKYMHTLNHRIQYTSRSKWHFVVLWCGGRISATFDSDPEFDPVYENIFLKCCLKCRSSHSFDNMCLFIINEAIKQESIQDKRHSTFGSRLLL